MDKQTINHFFTILSSENPIPKTELNYHSNFQLLIAVMLSAQSTDKSVNKATEILFKKASNASEILELGEENLKECIKTIGLFNNKAKYIIETCRILLEKYKGDIPDQREDLENLPGVGRKTANVVLNIAFNQPTIAVDTHVFRVCNRTHLALGKTPLEVEKQLLGIVPKKFMLNAHHWLILLGRYICLSKHPKCSICPVSKQCLYAYKTNKN